jgi:two-component system LytT family response regulator
MTAVSPMTAVSKLRVYLVDDEPLALKRLARLLEQSWRAAGAGMTCDPAQAIAALREQAIDVLFTDIQMPGLSGFEMLARVEPQPLVVFTTAYSEHALRAFEVNSIDYLMKPIDERQLDRALNKLERICGGLEKKPGLESLLAQLAAVLPAQKPFAARLASRCGDRIEFVDLSKVTHFYANDKLTYASTPKKDYVIDYTITDLEDSLDPLKFVRIHRSTVVNLEFVQELYSWFSDRMMVRINDGKDTELTVARERVRTLKDRLGLQK